MPRPSRVFVYSRRSVIISSIEAMLRSAMCKHAFACVGVLTDAALQLNAIAERCERTAKVMSEHGEERVPGFVDLGRIARHRLGQRLVDALAEAGEVFDVFSVQAAGFDAPETKDRRAQSTKLGNHLNQIESGQVPNRSVCRCRCRMCLGRVGEAFRLAAAFRFGLWTADIVGDRPQHFLARGPSVPEDRHRRSGRNPGLCEQLPLVQDGVDVLLDERPESRGRHDMPSGRGGCERRVRVAAFDAE